MPRTTLLFAIAITFLSVCRADDSPSPKSILKVYPVGDLVAAAAMKCTAGHSTTGGDCTADNADTSKALDELRDIVESMCSRKPMAVRSYAPSLVLIVRHSQEGHAEIDQLLQSLGEADDFSIQMECRALNLHETAARHESELTEAQRRRLERLLSARQLTKEETAELLALLPRNAEHKETVALKSGRRTTWGHAGRRCTVMGRVDHKRRTVSLRMDYVTGDDFADPPLFGSQVFSLADGQSVLFHHGYDGGTVIWLVSARILKQQKSSTLISQSDQ